MTNKIESLERLGELLDAGKVSPQEYDHLKAEVLGTGLLEGFLDAETKQAESPERVRPGPSWWIVALFAGVGFGFGIVLDVVAGIITIWVAGDLFSDVDYDSHWISVLVPYLTAAAFAFGTLARRKGGYAPTYRRITLVLSLICVTGIGLAVYQVADPPIEPIEPITQAEATWCDAHPTELWEGIRDEWDYVVDAWFRFDEEAGSPSPYADPPGAGTVEAGLFYINATAEPLTQNNVETVVQILKENLPETYTVVCRRTITSSLEGG
jgi:hypothetical protein